MLDKLCPILIQMPSSILRSLDAIALERAEPGMRPNRTATVRSLILEEERRRKKNAKKNIAGA